MLKSLLLYSRYLTRISLSNDRGMLLDNFNKFRKSGATLQKVVRESSPDREAALDIAVKWLLTAQKVTSDGGFSSYHLANGWSSSYPETTGYIIPTLLQYGATHDDHHAYDAAIRAADFLLAIQKNSGGWQGGRVQENKPEIVFNTGQVIRGMLEAFKFSGEKKYLESSIRAGNWLADIQLPEGYWKKHALMEECRVYDTFVDAPMADLWLMTGDSRYSEKAIANLEWVVNAKMHPNGWFEDCDNTTKHNDRPILHTIAYTLDGLIDCAEMLGTPKYLAAATIGAKKLRDIFLLYGLLNGRYDREWNGSEYLICTGGAQMAIVWLKLYRWNNEIAYLEAAHRMIDLLIFIQDRKFKEKENTLGAIPGSFPVWGRYEPFAFPNWATKFFCDAIMLEKEVKG
jgi:hypothetical protein